MNRKNDTYGRLRQGWKVTEKCTLETHTYLAVAHYSGFATVSWDDCQVLIHGSRPTPTGMHKEQGARGNRAILIRPLTPSPQFFNVSLLFHLVLVHLFTAWVVVVLELSFNSHSSGYLDESPARCRVTWRTGDHLHSHSHLQGNSQRPVNLSRLLEVTQGEHKGSPCYEVTVQC